MTTNLPTTRLLLSLAIPLSLTIALGLYINHQEQAAHAACIAQHASDPDGWCLGFSYPAPILRGALLVLAILTVAMPLFTIRAEKEVA